MRRPLRFLQTLFLAGLALASASSTPYLWSQITPPPSTFFSTASEESYSTYQMSAGNGDLWPSCWAADGNLYAANGDGTNFGSAFNSMAVGRIAGMPPNLTGTFVAGDVGQNYSGSPYTDKPTGMLCIGGAIYLAYQNLNESTFDDAPAASIVRSDDYGATWSGNPSTPMFGAPGNTNNSASYRFTTIFFLDYGKDYEDAIDGYVYAYGLDNNWREQTTLYLARVSARSVLDRSAWQFFAGMRGTEPSWTSHIASKVAVLTDERLLYQTMYANTITACPAEQKLISQGGVVYDKPLKRYLFSSWGCSTHQLYESPTPWGPWSLVLSKDFGPLLLSTNRGQYGTSIPSKFISRDGTSLLEQSNVCCGGDSYTFSLRKLQLVPSFEVGGENPASEHMNLAYAPGAVAISKSTHFGSLCGVLCADQLQGQNLSFSEDDWDNENKVADKMPSYWGYTWPNSYNINQVVYTTGYMFSNGGWFESDLRVQVRHNMKWVDVPGFTIMPDYPGDSSAGAQTIYTFNFPTQRADGVRIVGTPGGAATFTSISRLGIYNGQGGESHGSGSVNMVLDPGFELEPSGAISAPWMAEGPGPSGVDLDLGFEYSGLNDAWINQATTDWNAVKQTIAVKPNTNYIATAWVRDSFTSNPGYCGVRDAGGINVWSQAIFGAEPAYDQLTIPFNSGLNNSVTVFCGFWGTGSDQWLQMDDFSLEPGGSGTANLIRDPGFELQSLSTASVPWVAEGPDGHGIDLDFGFSHWGNNDAWIRDSSTNWNADTQTVPVQPNTTYVASVWVRNNFGSNVGAFGVRDSGEVKVLRQTMFSAAPNYTLQTVVFNSGPNTQVTVFCGFKGIGSDQYLQMDDFNLSQLPGEKQAYPRIMSRTDGRNVSTHP